MKLLRRHSVVTATAVLISACAIGPVQPDLSARAPDLAGFGEVQDRKSVV